MTNRRQIEAAEPVWTAERFRQAVRWERDLSSTHRLMTDSVLKAMEEIQGTWKQIAYERDGVKEPLDEQGWEPRATFSGNTFVVTLADGSVPIKGTFRLDPTREPKSMDLMDTFGLDEGKTFLAIYSLEGDRLVFCAADAGQERPSEFRTKLGQVLRVNQRETV